MSELVRCPDCGGIVGATETTDEGFPCTCFSPSSHADNDDASGTQAIASPATQKVCCMCGKDLAGKKRLKDSRGYWCPDCHAEDRKKHEVQGVKCEKCGRVVPGQSLTSVDGKRVCSRCVREERELRAPGNKKFRVVSDKAYKEHDKKKMLIMIGVLIVLLVLMYIAYQNFPPIFGGS